MAAAAIVTLALGIAANGTVFIALAACLIPARRALAVNPAQTLKEG